MKQLTTYIVRGTTTPEQILNEIKAFAKETTKDLEVTVVEVKDIRSSAQSKFYFGCVIPAFLEAFIGSPEEVITEKDICHEFLKALFLRTEKQGIKYTRSTTELTVEEMSEYIDKCIEFLVNDYNGTILERDRQVYEHSLGRK